MKRNLKSSLDSKPAHRSSEFGIWNAEFSMKNIPHSALRTPNCARFAWVVACCLLLVASVTGCESLQRKLTRKKKVQPPPAPVTLFQDYSAAITPLDRYQKHYAIFDYWNAGLLAALEARPLNPKRVMLASTEALGELETMKTLLTESAAARLDSLVKEQTKIHHEAVSPGLDAYGAATVARRLEAQTRSIHRDFFWRKVQDELKPKE